MFDRITMIPISMDASYSAYQIMSYFLFNKDLARIIEFVIALVIGSITYITHC